MVVGPVSRMGHVTRADPGDAPNESIPDFTERGRQAAKFLPTADELRFMPIFTAALLRAADNAEPVQSFLESSFVRMPAIGAACRRALGTAAIPRVPCDIMPHASIW